MSSAPESWGTPSPASLQAERKKCERPESLGILIQLSPQDWLVWAPLPQSATVTAGQNSFCHISQGHGSCHLRAHHLLGAKFLKRFDHPILVLRE